MEHTITDLFNLSGEKELTQSTITLLERQELDFSGKELTHLHESIGTLTWLRSLNLNYNELQAVPESLLP